MAQQASKTELKKEFQKRAERPEHLSRLLQKLEARDDLSALPLTDRSKALQFLTARVCDEAIDKNILTKDDRGACIHEPPFKREITQICRLLDSMKYSDYMMGWAISGAKALAAALRETLPFDKTAAAWSSSSLEEKVKILENITALQARIFKRGAFDLLRAPINLQNKYGALGYVGVSAYDFIAMNTPTVNISKQAVLTSEFNVAAYAAVHEQLHAFVTQMAIADFLGQMPKEHPLARDAAIAHARRRYLGTSPGIIRSAYDGDSEEQIAHACHLTFNREYTRNDTLSEKLGKTLRYFGL